ncbi:hypothetical protein ACFOX0_28280 [Micromonospora zhanjiangensis]|uniref:Ig-like domain-containing protein n=1 Tax=Micromonospora zhanjiangensis TaxID=1522057 RepID=A0ABV8KV25_9ACTN
MIVSIVLGVVVLLCGGGGLAAFLFLSDGESGEGAPEPVAAVDSFLTAVYVDKDPAKAAGLVCSEARDDQKLTRKVDEVKGYATKYRSPRFRWTTPKVDDQNSERARVSVTLTMTTADEKTTDQSLTFVVVRKTGWWVCDVGPAG